MPVKRKLYPVLLCFVLSNVFFPVSSTSQQLRYHFKNFTPSEGLPSSEVYQVLQDSRHYMWFATDHGVCRYNGYTFETFNLPDNSILGLYEDVKKRLWAYSFSGRLFYFQNGKFEVYRWNDQVIKAIKPGVINGIYVDSSDALFVSATGPSSIKISENGIVEDKFRQKKIPEFSAIQTASDAFYTSITAYPFRFTNMYSFENETRLTLYFKTHKLTISIPHLVLPERCRLRLLSNGDMVLCSRDCIAKISKNGTCQVTKTIFPVEDVEEIEGNYYIATGNGLLIQDKDGHTLSEYFKGLHITSIEKDYEGGLWFSSITKGVFYLNNLGIKHLSHHNAIVEKRAGVLSKSGDSTFLCGVDPDEIIKWSTGKSYEIFSMYNMTSISSFYRYSPSLIIVGGGVKENGFDFWRYSSKMRKGRLMFSRLPNSSNFVQHNGILYSGLHDRIFEFKYVDLKAMPKSSKDIFRVTRLFLTSKKEMLVGNQFGLWKYKDGCITAYDSTKQILKSRVTDIVEYKQKYLCLGTRGKGLLLMQNDSIYQITSASGLISNNIRRIFIEGNHIWLATNQGISIVTINSDKPLLYSIRNISIQDGLLSNEVNDMISDGQHIIAATNSGISFLDKNVFFKREAYKLPFYIKEIRVSGALIDSGQLRLLNYKKRNLSVSFEALNYGNPGKNNYRYRLLGFDTTWLYTNDLRIQFNPLPYGSYQLQIQAKREFDTWSQSSKIELPVQCNPPFWSTTWFFAISVIMAVLLSYLYFRRRVVLIKKRQREKEDLQKKIAETEQMALKSQMNPHFIFNSLNSIQQYVIESDVEGANTFISGFSKLIRQTLEFSAKERITLAEEISYLTNYLDLEKMRMENKFSYEVQVQTVHSLSELEIPPLLLQPYVENALRHGVRLLKKKEGIIRLFIKEQMGVLECCIEDNGIGREKALQMKSKNPIEYQSKGMSLSANRIELLNKNLANPIQVVIEDLKSQDNEPQGTRIRVYFPA